MPWFPYGFENGSDIPVYHELYPNALKEISEGVSGYIYEVFAIAFVQAPLGGAGAVQMIQMLFTADSLANVNAHDF